MMQYKIILKGLKPNEDIYETIEVIISAQSEKEADFLIADTIYEIRNKHLYYKIKYVLKEKLNEKCIL